MILRSGTFKSLTFSTNEFEEVSLEPALEVSEPSVSEVSIEIQDSFQHTSHAVVEEPLQDQAEPVGPQGQALNTNMAEAGKITVLPPNFMEMGKRTWKSGSGLLSGFLKQTDGRG